MASSELYETADITHSRYGHTYEMEPSANCGFQIPVDDSPASIAIVVIKLKHLLWMFVFLHPRSRYRLMKRQCSTKM